MFVHDLEPSKEVLPSANLESSLVACVEPSPVPSNKELDLNKPPSWGRG